MRNEKGTSTVLQHTSNPIEQIMSMRLSVLLPYAEDGDEGEMDGSDYIAFYSNIGSKCIADTNRYIDAINRFSRQPDSADAFSALLEARRAFINSFPFTADEIAHETHQREQIVEYMRSLYRKELRGERLQSLIRSLSQYRDLCSAVVSGRTEPSR